MRLIRDWSIKNESAIEDILEYLKQDIKQVLKENKGANKWINIHTEVNIR